MGFGPVELGIVRIILAEQIASVRRMERRVSEPWGMDCEAVLVGGVGCDPGAAVVDVSPLAPLRADGKAVGDEARNVTSPHADCGVGSPAFGFTVEGGKDLQDFHALLAEA